MFALQSILKRPPLESDSLCSFSGDKLVPGFKQVTHVLSLHSIPQSRDGRGGMMPAYSRGIWQVIWGRLQQSHGRRLCICHGKRWQGSLITEGHSRLHLGGSLCLPEVVCVFSWASQRVASGMLWHDILKAILKLNQEWKDQLLIFKNI